MELDGHGESVRFEFRSVLIVVDWDLANVLSVRSFDSAKTWDSKKWPQ
jgi:hypothetical protein